MIEAGIVSLVQSDSTVSALCSAGGYLVQLPKGTVLPSWSYAIVSEVPLYTLQGRNPFTMRRLQIDVYGDDGGSALTLAKAIVNVLSGYRGTLSDTDSTVVQGIFLSNTMDFFDETARTFRRMLEFEVYFNLS